MSDDPTVLDVHERARFEAEGFAKVDLAASQRLLLGLNCFEPGQAQPVHAHQGQDKFYYVVEGRGRFTLGKQEREVGPGGCVWAPAGVDHGLANPSVARLIVLVGIAPAPGGPA